ncbi:alpha/beta fold hydrolase [Dyella psychrodurans]|uniref:Alpha/beta hydrolase n=1 Tax=Dyella psychrodurans TaxID=1927960 RepID=A0A370X206_9GAMM|nr:alpha/beta hydrolase [Dyella psychrodurans]RDS82392.1 alpha/beta hydrolase [Dyella psychrodurans]
MRITATLAALVLLALAALPLRGAMAADTIEDGYFTTDDGARIHYLHEGGGAAPALVLIPGWTLTASLWREQLEHFSGDHRVIAIDSRSQGESSIMQTGNTPERRAQDLHELVASLHVDRFVLVGWSQGAQDVAAYVQQFGTGSLAGVAFVDSPVSAGTNELDIRKAFSKAILSGLSAYAKQPADYSAGMVRSIFKQPHPAAEVDAVIAQAQHTPPTVGTAMLVSDIFGADRRPALQKIDRPAWVIASANSPLLDAQKEMATAIRGAHLVVVPNAGHAVFVDDPQTFDKALGDLLTASDSARSR